MSKIVCKLCILIKGFKGTQLYGEEPCDYMFDTEEELFDHLLKEHGIRVKGYNA